MDITEVRIKLMEDADDRLQAFCSITFDDCFVVRDLKIIEGSNGPFVAMPSRKLTSHCSQCGAKNHLRAGYCNHCGARQRDDRAGRDAEGRAKLYADIAHPINSDCREMIQQRVIFEFRDELQRAQAPDYVSRYDDDYDFDDDVPELAGATAPPRPAEDRAPRETSRIDPAESAAPPHVPSTPKPQEASVRAEEPAERERPPQETADEDDFGKGVF